MIGDVCGDTMAWLPSTEKTLSGSSRSNRILGDWPSLPYRNVLSIYGLSIGIWDLKARAILPGPAPNFDNLALNGTHWTADYGLVRNSTSWTPAMDSHRMLHFYRHIAIQTPQVDQL